MARQSVPSVLCQRVPPRSSALTAQRPSVPAAMARARHCGRGPKMRVLRRPSLRQTLTPPVSRTRA